MRAIFATIAIVLLGATPVAGQDVYVQGYYRSDGTYVGSHYRSAPDNSYNNNWSVSPNVNPYTGEIGTNAPTFNDQPPSDYNSFPSYGGGWSGGNSSSYGNDSGSFGNSFGGYGTGTNTFGGGSLLNSPYSDCTGLIC